MNTTDITKIDEQIENLTHRRNMIAELMKRREEIDSQIEDVLHSEVIVETTDKQPKTRKSVLPRGVITAAAFEPLKGQKKPLSADEIVESVKSSPLLEGRRIKGLDKKVKSVLYSSPRFKQVGKGQFLSEGKKLEGRLFERLLS